MRRTGGAMREAIPRNMNTKLKALLYFSKPTNSQTTTGVREIWNARATKLWLLDSIDKEINFTDGTTPNDSVRDQKCVRATEWYQQCSNTSQG